MNLFNRHAATSRLPKGRRLAPVVGCAVAALLMSACGHGHGGSQQTTDTTTSPSTARQSSAEYGKYTGSGGGNSMTISFTASPSGIEDLTGFTLLTCSETNGNGNQYSVDSTIPLQSDGTFSSDTTTNYSSSVTAELKVDGILDGSGNASGTLSYALGDACDTGTIDWTASLAGASGSTSSTTVATNSSCSPQPCATNNGMSVSVQSLDSFVPDPGGPNPWIDVTFTITNGTSSPVVIAEDAFGIQPGNSATVPDRLSNGFEPTLSDGTTCDPGESDLQPGATSSPLHACVPLTAAQTAQPLKFIFAISTQGPVANGAVDLSSLTIGTDS